MFLPHRVPPLQIAAGGGIGGGGILVPTYIFVLGFEPKIAIPLSNATILGSSIANVVLNARKRHPKADRPLIDWDIMVRVPFCRLSFQRLMEVIWLDELHDL